MIILLVSTPGQETTTSLTYVDTAVSLPSVVALYGWAWRKPIGHGTLWRVYAAVFIIVDFVYNLFFSKTNMNSPSLALMGLVLVAPCYIATILYAIEFDKLEAI